MRDNITAPRSTDTPAQAYLRSLVELAGSVKAAAQTIQYPATMGELTIRKILSGHRPNADVRGWLARGAKRDARIQEAHLRDNEPSV
ncbi:hypothetical protein UFOVP842_31 [uncultured Caudovirales phage]|uniref:Uncharacterized protein n=1 Tax=uncultured Caudovirales phage TaxID=2100421 RepID=A0A6J5P3T8_9CAUD|nr:hypothetical protein UFOVP305_24 [uncultured Caudovirales phage]CAB4151540.1 hypothetical protein UFOVP593_21 [uncultured Caudovirales phage]CAB4166489.1 hypothetical protein UFOVP842_31 [uncultured Caudovirales phage]